MPDNEEADTSTPQSVTVLEPLETEYRTWKIERRRRLQILASVLPATFALVLLMIRFAVLSQKEYFYSPLTRYLFFMSDPLSLFILFGVSLFGLAMLYLQTGFKRITREQVALHRYDDELNSMRRQLETRQSENLEIRRLTEQLTNAEQFATPSALSPEAEAKLVDEVERKIRNLAAENVISELKAAVQERASKERWLSDVSNRFQDSFARLSKEVRALGNRGNLNLALGTSTTVVGLMLLGYFVVLASRDITESKLLVVRFIPRLSLVAFIELFAYFFLRLYKSSLAEIKYFQNEITNMELKAVSVFVAAQMANSDALEGTIGAFANVERNRILEKGQTTVELRRAEVEAVDIRDGLKEVIGLLKLAGKGSA